MTGVCAAALAVVGSVVFSACVVTDGGETPLPSASDEVAVNLAPGASETYEFDIEVEALGSEEGFRVAMKPTPEALMSDGIEVSQSWVRDDTTEQGWPEERVVVEGGHVMAGTLILALTNSTDDSIAQDLTITILASPLTVPGPTEDDLKLSIAQR